MERDRYPFLTVQVSFQKQHATVLGGALMERCCLHCDATRESCPSSQAQRLRIIDYSTGWKVSARLFSIPSFALYHHVWFTHSLVIITHFDHNLSSAVQLPQLVGDYGVNSGTGLLFRFQVRHCTVQPTQLTMRPAFHSMATAQSLESCDRDGQRLFHSTFRKHLSIRAVRQRYDRCP